MLVVAAVGDGAYRQIRSAPMSTSTSAPAVQFCMGPRRSVTEENGRSFQLRRSRGRADWSFARRRAVMKYRRSALWGSTTRGTSRAVHCEDGERTVAVTAPRRQSNATTPHGAYGCRKVLR